jgi:hypothetical protein
VCQYKLPILVGVNLELEQNKNSQLVEKPTHYVLVTGVNTAADGTQSFTIADPGHKANQSLDASYPIGFVLRGVVTDPTGDVSGLDITTGNNSDVSVIDPNGSRTGIDPTAGTLMQNIPQSAYFVDGLADAVTGQVMPGNDTHNVQIFQPAPGTYSIVVTGLSAGPASLTILPFSMSGVAQQRLTTNGNVEAPGTTTTYQMKYDPTGATPPSMTTLLGDRNGDGVVNCVDLDIVKASFGKKIGQTGFDPRADVNGDGVVNVIDLSMVAKQLPAGTVCQ